MRIDRQWVCTERGVRFARWSGARVGAQSGTHQPGTHQSGAQSRSLAFVAVALAVPEATWAEVISTEVISAGDLPSSLSSLSSTALPDLLPLTLVGGGWFALLALVAIALVILAGRVRIGALRKELDSRNETLRRREESLRELVRHSADMLYVCDLKGNISEVSDVTRETMGYSQEELETISLAQLDMETAGSEKEQRYQPSLGPGEVAEFETRLRRKDGGFLVVNMHGVLLECDDGTHLIWRARAIDYKPPIKTSQGDGNAYRVLFERSADASLIIDGDKFVDCNEAAIKMLRYVSREELCQMHPSEISPPTQHDGRASYEKANEMMALAFAHRSHRFEWEHQRADGEVFPVEVLLTAIPFEGRRILYVVWRDLTSHKQATKEKEELLIQLHQSQKMDAIGQLAGGIAHDFNNILTAILGNVELLKAELDRDDQPASPLLDGLWQIGKSAERAATLTRQLLTFGRRQASQPEVLDLGHNIEALGQMLHRLLTEDIQLKFHAAPDLKCVRADPGQVEQVVINLVVNARDAMPNGGVVEIELTNVFLDSDYIHTRPDARIGPHILLSVRDTGKGMSEETLRHIFEPFFTTKDIGRGTGLGLATVYGIVKQSGGHITVESALGQGSTFNVCWPAVTANTRPFRASRVRTGENAQGTETVLLCEDDLAVRELASEILREAGYSVTAASGGTEALEMASAHHEPIDMLITDVIMPDMNGKQVVEELRVRMPNVRVLFLSGYTDSVIAHHGVLDEGVDFLSKPFTRRVLLQHVREILDRETDSPGSTPHPSPTTDAPSRTTRGRRQ